MKQILYLCLLLCFSLCISLTSKAQTSITVSVDATTGKPVITKKGGESQVTNKALTATPCSITAISFAASFSINNACPGGRLLINGFGIAITGEPESCTEIAFNPLLLEMSNGAGDFSSPTVLFEGNIFQVAEALYGSDFLMTEGDNAYSLPLTLPPGTNYLLRLHAKGTNVVSTSSVGPFTVPEPNTSAITSLIINDAGCPVQIQTLASGYKQVLTGENGYIFSYVARNSYPLPPFPSDSPVALSFPVTKSGTYSFITAGLTTCSRQTITISKNCP